MHHWRQREPRKSVHITVRVRTDDGWMDATVRNVSPGGMMLHSQPPLRRNQFVEIARGRHRIVGRIVWSDAGSSGLQSRELLDISDLLGQAPSTAGAVHGDRRHDRRRQVPARAATFTERAESSRMMGRAIEHMFVVTALACVAVVATVGIGEALEAPIAKAGLAMAD